MKINGEMAAKSFERLQDATAKIASNLENTDLAEDFVNLNKAENLTKAAVKTIQSADEMTKNIIDLLA